MTASSTLQCWDHVDTEILFVAQNLTLLCEHCYIVYGVVSDALFFLFDRTNPSADCVNFRLSTRVSGCQG